MNYKTPIVFCHGLLGWGEGELFGYPYFVSATELKKQLQDKVPPFIFTSTGPVSSLHDQACELFFQLKGGLTDYGEEHSKKFNHKRYSRFYGEVGDYCLPEIKEKSTKYGGKALYPEWNKENPLDFVGHSMGAPLLTTLQQMLADDYFNKCCGFKEHTDSSWIHSISTVSGVHNGSQLTWFLGASEETGVLKDNAKVVNFLCKLIEKIGKYQNKCRRENYIYDLHLDQWDLGDEKNYSALIKKIAETNAQFYDEEDWAMYDLTPNSMENHNKGIKEYKDTWYFSYLSKSTFSFFRIVELCIPIICHWFLWLTAFAVGNYKVKNQKWKKITKRWHKNDGMCPTEGQRFPYIGRDKESIQQQYYKSGCLQKGVWNVMKTNRFMDHAEPAMLPHFCMKKKDIKFYNNIIKIILDTRV